MQRMLTIYMQFHQFDRPVINMHELTNGLAKYYSPEFNQEIVGKKQLKNWGYYQTLQEIVDLLSSVDHYKTSRLAHYHIIKRGDTLDQQVPFYNYLNENFFIIACRRANVFEHALSMTLNTITKKLNVYDAYEKISTFYDIYKAGVTLDPKVFVKQLDLYKIYISWSEQYFNIASYFNYEQDIPNLEKYILGLPVFAGQPKLTTWESNFGLDLNTWNKMHYARSDVNVLLSNSRDQLEQLLNDKQKRLQDYQQHAPDSWPMISTVEEFNDLPVEIKQQWTEYSVRANGVVPLLSQNQQQLLDQYQGGYRQAQQTIDQMINLGIMISPPPIKKQTLAEKAKIIKNFDQLIELYNHWAEQNPDLASPQDSQSLTQKIAKENQFWDLYSKSISAGSDSPPSLT